MLRIGELAIDLERYEVTLSGRKVALTYKEFQLLALLASNPGSVYSHAKHCSVHCGDMIIWAVLELWMSI